MDGVLEGAVVLCLCKLVCCLLFLPSLVDSYSPVSFCCSCILIFTDFMVTVFLSCLCILEPWLTELTPPGDVIALRFLLFLSHTYGAVLLLTTPLIAVATVIRLLWPRRTVSQTAGSDGPCCDVEEEDEEDTDNSDQDRRSHVVSYLCCLSVWVIVALNVRWRWELEEVWAAVCLHRTNSLVRCLPSVFSPIPSSMNPCWGMALLFLVLLLLTTSSTGLQRRHRAHEWTFTAHRGKRGVSSKGALVPEHSAPLTLVKLGTSVSEPALCVDPEKTESSCTVNRAWNSVQMSVYHHGDLVLIAPECLSGKRGGQEHERTKRGVSLTFITEEHVDSQYRSQCGWQQWGFPCLGVNAMIGLVCVLSIFALPLNLSVNILLIRTIDILLELCIKYLISSAANTRDTSTPCIQTLI